jgi:hypothetical protein
MNCTALTQEHPRFSAYSYCLAGNEEEICPMSWQQAAEHAEKQDPSIVERASQFYAQHPTLVQTLGALAMSVALSHLARRRS